MADDESAKQKLALEHPDYKANKEDWQVLLDAFEGSGGFLNGDYLWPYGREESSDFEKRQAMCRYHNFVEGLIDLYARYIQTQGVNRQSTSEDYNAWTEDVDGSGTSLDDLIRQFVTVALVHGHAAVLVDKTADEPTGPARADEKAQVIASVFTALAIQDWRMARGVLEAVKLREAAPQPTITDEQPEGDDNLQYLLWDKTGWARFDAEGACVGGAMPDLGMVPLVILRAKPRYTSQMLGRPLIGNANIPRALLNRSSEEDEVLRSQAFSVLTVEVPPDGNVTDAKADLGTIVGTSKALVVRGSIDYKTPSQDVAPAIRENIQFLIRELFRAAHVRYQTDSRDAESGQSIRLQNAELNEMLQGLARALALAERQIARCWFAWMFPTKAAADAAFEAAKVTVTYPNEFFLDDLAVDLEAWAEALRMGLGLTMTKHIKKKAVRRIDPDIPSEDLEVIDKEIDAMKDEPEPALVPLDRGDPEAQAIARAEMEMTSDAA